jgi:outer membrane receptor protein involved in Fe transport
MKRKRCSLLLAGGAALAIASIVSGQNNAPAREVIELSAFTVKESSDNSYIASESVTGTRVATQIKDLPFAVSVVTSEFMNDFDFFDIASDLAYVANLNGVDTQGNSNLRGYGATFYLRNGFYRLGLIDRVNTDRIEVIKGPNAAIYGATSPAGLINVVTKKPRFGVNTEHVTFTAGSLDMYRGEINVNTPLPSLGKVQFAQLFSANAQNSKSETRFATTRNRLLDENITAKFPDGSTLSFEIEWSARKGVPATSTVPFQYNSATRTYSSILRPDLAHVSQGGPDSVANRELTSAYLTYEKRWNRVWSSRVGTYAYARHAFNFNNGTSDQFDPVTGRFGRGNVITDPLNEDGGAAQVDTLADYDLVNGTLKNKTLLTIDYSQNWRYREQRSPNTRVFTINGILLANPDYSLPPRSAFNIVTRRDKVRWDTRGFFLRQQTTALDGRLIGFAGIRRDLVTYNFNFGDQFNRAGGALSNRGAVSHYTDSAWSPNFGANYKVTKEIAVYASHSTSFSPAGQVAKLGDPHLENETSVGWDYGIKASLLENRLVFTVGGFYIDRNGVKTTQRDPVTGLNETVAAGKQGTKGYEFEGSWRATDKLTVMASYGRVNAKILYNGNATTDIGRMPAGLPKDQGSVEWRWDFGNFVRGLSWNAGVIYSGDALPNSTATDARRDVRAPSYYLVNTGINYAWSQRDRRLRHSVRLSAKNALDREYYTSRGELGAERGVFFAYTLSH